MSTGRVTHSSLRKSLKLNSNPTDWWKVSLIMLLGDATDTLCSNYTETIQCRRAAATSCFLLRTGIHHIVATSFDTLRQPLATRPHKNGYIWSFWTVSKRPARISPPLVAWNDSCFCTHSTMSNDGTHTNGGRARTVRETQTQNGDKNGERVTHITASHLFWVVWVSRLQHHRAVS